LKNQSGFTLIEMLIAVGLLGLVTLGSATMFTTMRMQQEANHIRQDLTSLYSDLGVTISDPVTCTLAVTGLDIPFNAAAITPGTGLSPISFRLNGSVLREGEKVPGYELIADTLAIRNAISVGSDDSGEIYRGELFVSISSGKQILPGQSGFKPRTVGSFFLTVAAGKVVGCSNRIVTTNSGKTEICEALGGFFDTGLTRCVFPTDVRSVVLEICPSLGGTLQGSTCVIQAAPGSGGGGSTSGEPSQETDRNPASPPPPSGPRCVAVFTANAPPNQSRTLTCTEGRTLSNVDLVRYHRTAGNKSTPVPGAFGKVSFTQVGYEPAGYLHHKLTGECCLN